MQPCKRSRPRILNHPSADLIGTTMKGSSDVVGITIGYGNSGRPSDDVSPDRPDLNEQIGPSEPPIFEYVGHRTGDMDQESSNNESHRLRIGTRQAVVHNLWEVI